jgi:signal peptide peptidase SppA
MEISEMKIKSTNQNNSTIANSGPVISNRRFSKWDTLLSMLPLGLGGSKPVVAIFRLEGVIGKAGGMKAGLTLNALNKLIEKMFKIDKLDAVCLAINSPGGSPVQAEIIANRIIKLAKEKEVPVYSFVEDVAASGGYWLACAGEKIFASQSSIVGSIGVISSGFGFHEAIGKLGIERRVYTEGKTKSVLDPFKPEKESDIKIIKKIQRDIHEHFVNYVKGRRAGCLTQSDEILFNGEFWAGQIALDYGLVDGIDDVYSFIKNKFGDSVKIEHIEHQQSWLKKRLGMSQISKEIASDVATSIVDTIESKLQNSKFDLK